jgi:ABC-type transporter Mla subunit MlaD
MKMSAKENGLEVKVGLFLCIGIAIIGAMVLEFSLGGKQGFNKKYESFYVDLPDAAGLLKGSEVLLAGSNIGYVADKPRLSSDLSTVRVTLKINGAVKIPIGSTFKVASSGLLGDKYVAVQTGANFKSENFNPDDPKQVYQPVDTSKPDLKAKIYNPSDPKSDPVNPEFDPKLAYQPGDVILGAGAEDLTEIAAQASKQLTGALTDFKEILNTLKSGVLSPASMQNLQDSMASLKTTTQSWADASQQLPPIAKSAKETVDKANVAMGTVQTAAESLRTTLATAGDLMNKAAHGEGLIGELINNHQLADNFNALVINLKEHGVLFYHDTAKGAQPTPTPSRDKRQH